MTDRKRPDGGEEALRIEFVRAAKRVSLLVASPVRPGGNETLRVKRGFARVHVIAPSLGSFAGDELTPASVLRGAGLDMGRDIPASAVIEAGLPAAVVRDFAVASGVTVADVGAIVGTSERTMSRKLANDERLGAAESDRAYRLFDAVARAVHAFGDVDKARRWIHRAVPSLGGRAPVHLLRTAIGTRDVLSALDRIEFGGVA